MKEFAHWDVWPRLQAIREWYMRDFSQTIYISDRQLCRLIKCPFTVLIIGFVCEPIFGVSFPTGKQKITTSVKNFSIYLLTLLILSVNQNDVPIQKKRLWWIRVWTKQMRRAERMNVDGKTSCFSSACCIRGNFWTALDTDASPLNHLWFFRLQSRINCLQAQQGGTDQVGVKSLKDPICSRRMRF